MAGKLEAPTQIKNEDSLQETGALYTLRCVVCFLG